MSSPATAPATQQGTRETSPAEQELVRWQRKQLPVMTGFIISLASIFFCFSAIHLYQVTKFIQTEHGLDIRAQIESEIARPPGESSSGEEMWQESLVLVKVEP